MKQIEFRGKRVYDYEWVYGSLIIINNVYYIYDKNISDFSDSDFRFGLKKISKETICQYTGLKDKNYAKIYEGDIVKHDIFGKKEITWGNKIEKALNDCCGFMYSGTIAFLSISDGSDIIKIGNIYDNPELLGIA